MTTWLDDLRGKNIIVNGVEYPDRKKLNLTAAGAVVADNPASGATDITLPTSGGGDQAGGSITNVSDGTDKKVFVNVGPEKSESALISSGSVVFSYTVPPDILARIGYVVTVTDGTNYWAFDYVVVAETISASPSAFITAKREVWTIADQELSPAPPDITVTSAASGADIDLTVTLGSGSGMEVRVSPSLTHEVAI